MKKIFLSFIVTIIFTGLSCAQTKEDLDLLSITKTENISSTNQIVSDFYSFSNFKTANNEIVLDEKTIQLLTLKNGYQALKFKTSDKIYNNLYAVYNKTNKDFFWFFINLSDVKIELFSSEKDLLSSYSNINGNVHMNNIILDKRSPFGACMDAVEEDFTNDITGWLAWNTNPLYSATAAVHCHGCIKKWWACPKAYLATLGN